MMTSKLKIFIFNWLLLKIQQLAIQEKRKEEQEEEKSKTLNILRMRKNFFGKIKYIFYNFLVIFL